jgi:hypothetical protein
MTRFDYSRRVSEPLEEANSAASVYIDYYLYMLPVAIVIVSVNVRVLTRSKIYVK